MPSADASLDVASVEWIARDVVFDAPTIFDDADGFDWGAPNDNGEYVLAARFDDQALAPFSWTADTAFCDGDCHGRAVSAACSAQIVMRVWLADGTTREATADHESARPTCSFLAPPV